MPRTITQFDVSKHHIHTIFFVTHPSTATRHIFRGIIDTGAPRTEFSDVVLARAGFIEATSTDVRIKEGLQTQKYGTVILPQVEICGQSFQNLEAFVSKLDESWGIDALIGLDFFRRFEVVINYKKAQITVEPLIL